MASRSGMVCALAAAFLLGCTSLAFSQATTAQLNGTVLDPNGAAVVKASITLRQLGTNRTYTATSNDAGLSLTASLPPGTYELTVASTGFAKYTQTGVELTVGQTATVNVTLKATVEESIVVTTDVPAIEPTRTETSQVIDT